MKRTLFEHASAGQRIAAEVAADAMDAYNLAVKYRDVNMLDVACRAQQFAAKQYAAVRRLVGVE